jgi:hypothetical protein
VDAEITARLLKTAEDAARSGIQVEIRQYNAALYSVRQFQIGIFTF